MKTITYYSNTLRKIIKLYNGSQKRISLLLSNLLCKRFITFDFQNRRLLCEAIMKYQEFINNILESRDNIRPSGVYMEKHHIVPKCMGGTNEGSNLIYLTAKEHFIAHKMLCEENPNEPKLAYAFSMMAFPKTSFQQRKLTPEEYEEARKLYSKSVSGKNNIMYGKSPYEGKSLEECEEINRKRSNSLKGKVISAEHRLNISKALKGRKLSDEFKEKLKAGSRHLKTKGTTGMHWYTNGTLNVLCYPENCPEGYKKGYTPTEKFLKACIKNLDKARQVSMKGRHWYNNGKENVLAIKCPEGYIAGKLYNSNINKCRDKYGRFSTINEERRKILNLDTGEVFNSSDDVYKKYTDIPSISSNLTGKRKSAGGYYWAYYDEYKKDPEGCIQVRYGETATNKKKIINLDTKEIFSSISEAQRIYKSSHIGDCCRGTRNVAGGYHWAYYEDYTA